MVSKLIEPIDVLESNNDIGDESKNCYRQEWDFLFASSKYYLERLKSSAVKGHLKNSHFRSIAWKLFLDCLPSEPNLWIKTTETQRKKYEEILNKFNTNPRNDGSFDIIVNNPLSQSKQSPWNQYFQDAELKILIQQDVVRTFPEIEFFHSAKVQKMMISILFSYAREFPHISYKQGMHELLAPVLYVLHYDQQACLQATETTSLELDLLILLNQNYMEHDAFFLFCHLMEIVEPWYQTSDYFDIKYLKLTTTEPFSQNNTSNATSLCTKLKRIYEHLLKHRDTELFMHLEEMEITPQIFGIRWIRLLFGREFPIHDLLIVWDAIFADSITFDLVDYIFVSMLVTIRELLLQSDYTSCLRYLMHFPNVMDVQYIIELALHLRDPDGFKKPDGDFLHVINPVQFKSFNGVKNAVNKITEKTSKYFSSNTPTENRPKSLSIASIPLLKNSLAESPNLGTRKKSSSFREENKISVSSDPDSYDFSFEYLTSLTVLENRSTPSTLPRTRIHNVMDSPTFKSADLTKNVTDLNQACNEELSSKKIYREMKPFAVPSLRSKHDHSTRYAKGQREDCINLETEVSDLKLLHKYCTQQLSLHLKKLQDLLVQQDQKLNNEDEMFIALAGLKRVKDLLNGTINFTEEHQDDINPYSNKSEKPFTVLENDQIELSNVNSDVLCVKSSDSRISPSGDSIEQKADELLICNPSNTMTELNSITVENNGNILNSQLDTNISS